MKYILTFESFNENSMNATLTFYRVVFETENASDVLYFGLDSSMAEFEYANDPKHNRRYACNRYEEIVKTYRYIADLDDYPIEDYPIADNYEDKTSWEEISCNYKNEKSRKIPYTNKTTDDIITEVDWYFYKKSGKFKYHNLSFDDYRGREHTIQLRIADHTQNVHNIDKYGSMADFYISVAICNDDPTKSRFGMANQIESRKGEYELHFNSSQSANEIIDEIENKIEEIKDGIL